ncbi:MAG TPA: hypothetical protein PK533_04865 [Rectinema sp.]|jgi:hypothetical protein|nr:hypothetical protein [Rectinema sp.]HPW47070.1 hypothetical protein [Rectinema sp.]
MVSFEKSHTLLHELGSLIMETKEIERGAEALGKGIAEDEYSYISVTDTERKLCTLGLMEQRYL